MRPRCWPLILTLAASQGAAGENRGAEVPSTERVDFVRQVRPILDRCQPCHFKGGTMYGKYPFDTPDTLHQLGERLFTRIKHEKERTILLAFLAQGR